VLWGRRAPVPHDPKKPALFATEAPLALLTRHRGEASTGDTPAVNQGDRTMRRCLSLFVAGLVSCLAASPAAFGMIAAPGQEVREHFTLTIAGTLGRVVPGKVFPDGHHLGSGSG
jgi:hypothetical protein